MLVKLLTSSAELSVGHGAQGLLCRMAILDSGGQAEDLGWFSKRMPLYPRTFNHEQIWTDWDSAFAPMKHVD
jgi:hypothetical protein